MCRNIKKLRFEDRRPTDQELQDAALQFVRKISGYRKPPRKNQEIFNHTVIKIADICNNLFSNMKY